MTIITTPAVVAVPLGIAPLGQGGSVTLASLDVATRIGHYSETVDNRGTTHVKGHDDHGRPTTSWWIETAMSRL